MSKPTSSKSKAASTSATADDAVEKPARKAKSAAKAPKAAAVEETKPVAGVIFDEPVFRVNVPNGSEDAHLSPFLKKQKQRMLSLRDSLLDSMQGVAQDNLRSRPEGSEASAFGMHHADAGSDAYDRDFALSLLSQEQDALYEIEEALKRLDGGNYGVCEMSGKAIPHARLEAMPFTRYTVECQAQLEKQNRGSRARQSVTSLFGLSDEDGESDDDEPSFDNKE